MFMPNSALAVKTQPGYVYDVNSEVSIDPVDIILIETPESLTGPSLNEKVFNHELSREFIYQYQLIFGRTEQEENFYLINRNGYVYSTSTVVTATQVDQARQQFAQYMGKKLIEFHGENIMKNDPQLKAVYKLKQQVTNIKVTTESGMKYDLMYDFIATRVTAKVTHPFVNTYLITQMDPGAFLVSAPQEVNFYFEKHLTPKIKIEFGYLFYVKTLRFTLFQDITQYLSANFTQTVAMTQEFSSIDKGRESLSFAGLKFIF